MQQRVGTLKWILSVQASFRSSGFGFGGLPRPLCVCLHESGLRAQRLGGQGFGCSRAGVEGGRGIQGRSGAGGLLDDLLRRSSDCSYVR